MTGLGLQTQSPIQEVLGSVDAIPRTNLKTFSGCGSQNILFFSSYSSSPVASTRIYAVWHESIFVHCGIIRPKLVLVLRNWLGLHCMLGYINNRRRKNLPTTAPSRCVHINDNIFTRLILCVLIHFWLFMRHCFYSIICFRLYFPSLLDLHMT